MSATEKPTCGQWMPRARANCARGLGHPPPCASPEAMKRQRQQAAKRRPDRVVAPSAKARWFQAWKYSRYGITEERFSQMLEEQDYACGICQEPFGNRHPRIDHDHACCPVPPSGRSRSCGNCVRGLLCVRCNAYLGWLEKHDEAAREYLERAARVPR